MRKILAFFAILLCVSLLLASCQEAAGNTSDVSSDLPSASPVSVAESSSKPSSITLISEPPAESSESTSSEAWWTELPAGADPTKDPNFDGRTYVNPTCPYDHVDLPTYTDSAPIQIRSLRQTQSDVVLTQGFDPNDAEANAALEEIRRLLADYPHRQKISFVAYSMDGTKMLSYNCEQGYFSACTIKTCFIYYCCLAIDSGLASKDTVLIYQPEKYFYGGSGIIAIDPKNNYQPYTLETLINLALSRSDNAAYRMLLGYFGIDGYNRMMTELGLERLQINPKVSSYGMWNYDMNAHDLAVMWRELSFYFQSGSPMSKLYYNSTTGTNISWAYAIQGIPDVQNGKVKYTHKSGDAEKNPATNDGAIVWAENPYIIVVLNGTVHRDNKSTVDAIAQQIHEHLMK